MSSDKKPCCIEDALAETEPQSNVPFTENNKDVTVLQHRANFTVGTIIYKVSYSRDANLLNQRKDNAARVESVANNLCVVSPGLLI